MGEDQKGGSNWPICPECGGRHAPTKPGCCSGTYDGGHAPPWGLGRLREDREAEQQRYLASLRRYDR